MDKQNTQRGMQNAWQPIAQHGRAQTPVTRIKISAPQEDKNTFMQNAPEVKAQMLSAPAGSSKLEAPAENAKLAAPADLPKVEAPVSLPKVEASASLPKVEAPAEPTRPSTPIKSNEEIGRASCRERV